jgi:hypothetical protein
MSLKTSGALLAYVLSKQILVLDHRTTGRARHSILSLLEPGFRAGPNALRIEAFT